MLYMKKKLIILPIFFICCASAFAKSDSLPWPPAKADEWYRNQEWPVGCNFVPSYAINQLEMWQDETFDLNTIDKELGLAQSLGFNTIRIYLHEILWQADKVGFKFKINQVLDIAKFHKMRVIITFFTNGGWYNAPKIGPQPALRPGVHGSQWIQSPGTEAVNNPDRWPDLKKYVQDILRTYKNDSRILYWCLYNEPENLRLGCESMPLLREVFKWAREVKLSQPVSASIWIRPGYKPEKTILDVVAFICTHSDIITFHCYYGPEEMRTFIKMLRRFDRPLVCEEYMGRPNSTFEEIMPILKKENVGAISWGLVRGKCNFYLPWGHKPADPEPKVWFHDIFNPDGTPFSQEECDSVRVLTKDRKMKF